MEVNDCIDRAYSYIYRSLPYHSFFHVHAYIYDNRALQYGHLLPVRLSVCLQPLYSSSIEQTLVPFSSKPTFSVALYIL